MTDEQKNEIILRILQEVENKGSTRIGYHAEQVLGMRQGQVPYNYKSKIEGTIIKNKRYKSRMHPNFYGDYEIIINPDYKEEQEIKEKKELEKLNLEIEELQRKSENYPILEKRAKKAELNSTISATAALIAAILAALSWICNRSD